MIFALTKASWPPTRITLDSCMPLYSYSLIGLTASFAWGLTRWENICLPGSAILKSNRNFPHLLLASEPAWQVFGALFELLKNADGNNFSQRTMKRLIFSIERGKVVNILTGTMSYPCHQVAGSRKCLQAVSGNAQKLVGGAVCGVF